MLFSIIIKKKKNNPSTKTKYFNNFIENQIPTKYRNMEKKPNYNIIVRSRNFFQN